MRNRGIEVYLAGEDDVIMSKPAAGLPVWEGAAAVLRSPDRLEAQDMAAIIALEGVPGTALPRGMVAAHLQVASDAAAHHRWAPTVVILNVLSMKCSTYSRDHTSSQ